MSSIAPGIPDGATPPSSAWVRFLRSYGPTPNNSTLFDEYVTGALDRAKVSPIELSSPMLNRLKARVESKAAGSILVAGTAGDGKTYHCRSLWISLGGSSKEWGSPSKVKTLALADGRRALFVKDLSELSDDQSDEALGLLERSALGGEDAEFAVIAANHGQILERLRDLGHRQGRKHPLRAPVQAAFLQGAEPLERLAIFDLSRATHRESIQEILAAVAGHSEWANCEVCPLKDGGRVCPIYENKNRLLGQADGGRFARRLGDLVEVAKLNGWHLPVRDLLALAANMILGHRDAKEGLLACADVAAIQAAGTVERGSLYDNVFGANLPRRRAMDRPVFRAFSSFAIGEETTNGADGLIVYGRDDVKLADAFERLVASDGVYGATAAYRAAQERYLEGEEGARVDGGAGGFLDRLESQRRRLFFTLPETEGEYPFWSLSAFRFAGDYIAMVAALGSKSRVDENTRNRLVRGLNRVMTGLLIDNHDKIFVASSGGFTQSRVSVLCDTEASARRAPGTGTGMSMKLHPQSGRALLDVALAPGADSSVAFELSPVRFEFLCRVAEGALPGSFSNECWEDMLAFKAKMLRKAELIRERSQPGDDEEAAADEGALTLNFIEIEQSGHGFSRPVTVRVDA